ncbi:hypothetical protein RRX38_01045 [Pseudomonas sp. DTU_2021_1001937_2_SI_NGA_ILE_001]|uniref:hypothetical protein n=1 Tax=Pseudomonas sp. DTU_2021_1001937_2_SI_NGA_ILE_001 TaxID=3077589 RepID=UPI0028FC1A20|nr:hypothetical protein [Pseudomonas sp. DTU_2021_1001937_2_SI_NGA_ILE_001]WNW09790.1 hypothetical protein RRX38_01045 [Pseudomonas sp. DTU_2021_1001937_2_SI_NGA_ILE_001]
MVWDKKPASAGFLLPGQKASRKLPGCGHLMMLEDPQGFVDASHDLIASGPA